MHLQNSQRINFDDFVKIFNGFQNISQNTTKILKISRDFKEFIETPNYFEKF